MSLTEGTTTYVLPADTYIEALMMREGRGRGGGEGGKGRGVREGEGSEGRGGE